MPRNIVVLSDGTGNSAAKLQKTNVWRLYSALDVSDAEKQIARYDNGVGTSGFRPLALLGGAFGIGLKRNVLDLYGFVCRNYHEGDRIYAFGFSRGAFTARIVCGMIARVGLVPFHDEAQFARDLKAAYRKYRSHFNVTGGLVKPLRGLRDAIVALARKIRGVPQFDPKRLIHVGSIQFVGVWDTVAAYGSPIQEITRGIDYWIWPLSMPDRRMSGKIRRACHALALDDERNTFWPVLWDEHQVNGKHGPQKMEEGWAPIERNDLAPIDRQRLSQVWFMGMHSDVGGGYAQDGLAYVTLDWMMDRAEVYGLLIRPEARQEVSFLVDAFDRVNDSRHGLAGYYRYKPRKLFDVYSLDSDKPSLWSDLGKLGRKNGRKAAARARISPMIHDSVFRRIAADVDGYAPIVVPESYRVTDKAGRVVPSAMIEDPSQATSRLHRQEKVWNKVWFRRLVYFLTVFASTFLVLFPLMFPPGTAPKASGPADPLIPAIVAARGFAPSFLGPWFDAFQARPGFFAIEILAVSLLLMGGAGLQRGIRDAMLHIWLPELKDPPRHVNPAPEPKDLLYRIRTSDAYGSFFYGLTHWILPTFCAFALVWLALVGVSRSIFAVEDSFGGVCNDESPRGMFGTTSVCFNTGEKVEAGREYLVMLTPREEWCDGCGGTSKDPVHTQPGGFGRETASWKMALGVPLRREIGQNWFAVIARVGSEGKDEQVLRFDAGTALAPGEPKTYTAKFVPTHDGGVYLFVNDSVYLSSKIRQYFYENNTGTAEVHIKAAPSAAR